jgi:hypothetical protein
MSPVWVNGKFLDETPSKKIEKWKPVPQELKVWRACPECGQNIYENRSHWVLPTGFVCTDCSVPYCEQGIGFIAPAGFEEWLGLALEG